LYGTEFEIKLRNKLSQKAIAKECADWIRQKVTFKSNITSDFINGFMNVENENKACTYQPLNGFSTVDIGCERGNNITNMITKLDTPISKEYIRVFEDLWHDSSRFQDVTEEVLDNITVAYRENAPDFIYFLTLYNIFSEFLEDISEDVLPNEATGFKNSKIWNMLYDFQKDATLSIINKLEKYNGCILADSVGLGKTFTALAVIKYYEGRNKTVLVLCPKKLSENWNTFKDNYVNNPIAADRLNYDVLYHTDLSRTRGVSNGLDLARLNWGNYDLVVIDESHNFRNGIGTHSNTVENRYSRLMDQVIRTGVKTKVLMLSATPVNNRFLDLRNQLALAYEGDPQLIDDKLDTSKTIDEIFRSAQATFTNWSKLQPEKRTTANLLSMLDFDFFEVLDSVTIARSRKHIQKYYDMTDIGAFPTRLKPISKRPNLTDLNHAIKYDEISELLLQLNLSIYTPTAFLFPSRLHKYDDPSTPINQSGREKGMQRLMSINLLKRLESSVHAFGLTVERIADYIRKTIEIIDQYQGGMAQMDLTEYTNSQDFDEDDQNTDYFTVGKKVRIDLADMDYKSWRKDLAEDLGSLELLLSMVHDIQPHDDKKLQTLIELIHDKFENPINPGNKKILIFTAFADTANYLYQHVSQYVKEKHGLHTAMITGSEEGKTTIPKFDSDMNKVLTCFSPLSKDKHLIMPDNKDEIDILIATDCISEGQNLQDCDYVVNYDIHWNPVRIIQRFGRIDRIGSRNKVIQLVNFWPDITLDDYINLKSRVETRMIISVMTSTGDDDLINAEEKGDLEYRKAQLQRLQEEVVDIEDMSNGISIMDLGLNEFRLDLLDYIKHHPEIERAPNGMEAVVAASNESPAGVIFVLRNLEGKINKNDRNRLHPFYMVYIAENGEIVCNHLAPKDLLDKMRFMCRGKDAPDLQLCQVLNRETKGGLDMSKYAALLKQAIHSIIDLKDESDIASLFRQ
ncbi:MAG TPA: helicase-related protein, partial [Anaerolineaceae bacterium]|nr:helicase-related protein [Anaerolineaceae bacterium]